MVCSIAHSFPKTFSFIRSKFEHIKQFSRHAPYLAIPPSVHFFTSFQPPFKDKTKCSQNFDSSLWAGASEFPAGSPDSGQGITKWFYGPLSSQPARAMPAALSSLVHSDQHAFLARPGRFPGRQVRPIFKRLSPHHSGTSSIPACGPLLHVILSFSTCFSVYPQLPNQIKA